MIYGFVVSNPISDSDFKEWFPLSDLYSQSRIDPLISDLDTDLGFISGFSTSAGITDSVPNSS